MTDIPSISANGPQAPFIAMEGLDRAGKSTQCTRLIENLGAQDVRTKLIKFPDRSTPTGQLIDQYLRGQIQLEDHAVHLLFSANRWEAAATIKETIASGITVIVDRYYYSGCVYSAAKDIPGLDLEWARWPEVGLPNPDVCIFLDLTEAEAQKRGGYGEERYETIEMQRKVRRLFEQMRRDEKDRFRVIDATASQDQVARNVLDIVLQELDRARKGDLPATLSTVQPSSRTT